jgi:tetratricopeptide (TPR) repeat protein
VAGAKPKLAQDAAPRNYLLLVEACMLYEAEKHGEALETLTVIQPQYFDKAVLARYYLYFMFVSGALGDFDEHDRYMTLARTISSDLNYHEFLLRIDYDVAMFLVNQGKFEEVKRLARIAIRLAARQRLLRSLCTMYFIASVAYHEEGNQRQALKYLDRAVGLATDIGMTDRVAGYLARYGLIHRSLGKYGSAIQSLTFARSQLVASSRQYLFATAVLLDVYTTINSSSLAEQQARELEGLLQGRSFDQQLALSHKYLGEYRHKTKEYAQALEHYAAALEIYERLRNEDDTVRTKIAMGHTYLAAGKTDSVSILMRDVREIVERLKSDKIRAEYAILWLDFELTTGANSGTLEQAISHCEVQLNDVGEMESRIAMGSLLFRAHVDLGQHSTATPYFQRLYAAVKEVCSNLPTPRHVAEYISRPDFVSAVEKFRSVKAKAQAND